MPNPPAKPRLIYFLACDQARSETTNKNLLIGVYGSAMIVEGSFPAFLPSLSLVACMRVVKKKEPVRVRVRVPGLPEDQEHTMTLEAGRPLDSATYMVNVSPCVIPRPGKITVEYGFEDGHVECGELEVIPSQDYKQSRW